MAGTFIGEGANLAQTALLTGRPHRVFTVVHPAGPQIASFDWKPSLMNRSVDLIDQYRQLHASQSYGATAYRHLRFLRPHIRQLAPGSIIDFGCGQSRFLDDLQLDTGVSLHRYDPAIPELSERPTGRFDLLVSIDMLEHVPDEAIDEVALDMASLCRDALIVIDMRPAKQILPNGENAHCSQHPAAWWQERLAPAFPRLIPIQGKRGRAAFRTWDIPAWQQSKLAVSRVKENAMWLMQMMRKSQLRQNR